MRKTFREAAEASRGWNLFKSVGQMIVFWTVFLLVLPAAVYWFESWLGWEDWRFQSRMARACGAALFLAGSSLGVSSCVVMACRGEGTPLPVDCARKLVVAGPYRVVRNPMAVAGLVQGVAVGLWAGSPAIVLYALTGGPVWHLLVRPWEEADLEQRFGEPYRRYRAAVRCWLPRVPGYSLNKEPAEAGGRGDGPQNQRERP